MEADSLNCSVLGKDSIPGTADFDIFYKRSFKRNDRKSWSKMYSN